jgi:hypothetical protein
MKSLPRRSLIFALLLSVLAVGCHGIPDGYSPREGDLVFQSFPPNPLTQTIEGVSESPLSHCGIVAGENGRWVVWEAIGPVKATPLREWIARGRRRAVAVYRLQPPHDAQIPRIVAAAREYRGLPYDMRYRWDDRAIYCSELVAKAARDGAGLALGKMEKLGDLNWRPHEAKIRILEGGPPPLDLEMVTPVSLVRDPKTRMVFLRGYKEADGELREP